MAYGDRVQHDRHQIREDQEPGAEKGVVFAEGETRERELSAGHGVAVHHVAVVEGDENHGQGRNAEGKRDSERPCLGQEIRAGHDERHPANDRAE